MDTINKSLTFLFIAISFSGMSISDSFAQTDPILVGSKTSDFTVVDLHDTLMNGLSVVKYELDLDQNKVPDLTFLSSVYGGTGTSIMSTTVIAADSCTFSISKKGKIHSVSPTKDTTYFSATIVNIFNPNDTLYSDSCHTSNTTAFATRETKSVFQTQTSVDGWISGPHYMGIKKVIDNKLYLGWIKLEVTTYYAIRFMEYAIQTMPVGMHDEEQPLLLIYPNPVQNQLTLEGAHYRKIEIVDALGKTLITSENKNQAPIFPVDVQQLKPGIYFIIVSESGSARYAVSKFVKY